MQRNEVMYIAKRKCIGEDVKRKKERKIKHVGARHVNTHPKEDSPNLAPLSSIVDEGSELKYDPLAGTTPRIKTETAVATSTHFSFSRANRSFSLLSLSCFFLLPPLLPP